MNPSRRPGVGFASTRAAAHERSASNVGFRAFGVVQHSGSQLAVQSLLSADLRDTGWRHLGDNPEE